MNFGEAIYAMKMKSAVRRTGWNGKGMFLYYVPEGRYAPCTGPGKLIVGDDGKVPYGAYIAMKTAQGNVVPWLASQTDMLSDDWEVCTADVVHEYKPSIEEEVEGIVNTVIGVPAANHKRSGQNAHGYFTHNKEWDDAMCIRKD